MYESIASTIYLSSSHEGSNKTGRRANKDAYLLCTRSNGPYNSARSERRVGFEEGGLIGRRGIKTGREIDSSNGIRGHFFLNSRRRVTHRFVSPVESIRPKCHFYFQWNPPFHFPPLIVLFLEISTQFSRQVERTGLLRIKLVQYYLIYRFGV